MQPFTFRLGIFHGSVLCWLLVSNPVNADITPDTTLPVNSTVTSQGTVKVIDGGTLQGENLLHSFKDFSFSNLTPETTGNTAYFNNDLAVKNIITRVTGGLPSNIDGIIKANGTANLFIINPAGIVFGQNASLDIGGSFIASTATSLKFPDGKEFSAVDTATTPLLTINVPIGLQFGANSGAIINQSQASPDNAVNSAGLPVGLRVESGKTLALVSNSLLLEGGNLTASDGRVELGSVAPNSFVSLNEINQNYILGYTDIQNFGDIQLSGGAVVDTSGDSGGTVQIQGQNITLIDNSQVFYYSFLESTGQNLIINATDSLKLSGGSFIGTFAEGTGQAGDVLVKASEIDIQGTTPDGIYPSGLGSQVCTFLTNCENVTGNGGNLIVEAEKLFLRDGAIIDASTFGAGKAGNVQIKAFDFIEIIGSSPDDQIPSGIFAQVGIYAPDIAGDAGNLTIETPRLTILDGGQISAAGRTGGKGGNLTINASNSIILSGAAKTATRNIRRSGIFASAEPGATRDAGELKITTEQLIVENNAEISANNFGLQKGGTATLNVRKLILRNGGEVRARSFGEGSGGELIVNSDEFVEITGSGSINSEAFASALSTSSEAAGKAGNLIINTPILNVRDGGEVTVSATGSGAAGNLTANANTIRLNQGKLTAETNAGEGANISLENLQLLTLQNQSLISAEAFNNANGGNIIIDAPDGFIVAVPNQNNDIVANAFQGQGGKIDITARSIFSVAERRSTPANTTNDIDASSEFGLTGSITINTPDVDPSRGLVQLPENLTDASQQIVSSCNPGSVASRSSFTITGRGGIARSPMEPLQGEVAIARWIKLDTQTQPQASNITPVPPPDQIVEAQSWIFDNKGNVTLVAQAPTIAANGSSISSATCGVW